MQAVQAGFGAMSLSDVQVFCTRYKMAEYKSVYCDSEDLKKFMEGDEIDLERVRLKKDEFFRCMIKLCPQANPVEEMKMLASCATPAGDGKGYSITVKEPSSMVLFANLARVATKEKSCVPENINRELKLDDGTCIRGFIPNGIPNSSCPGALSEDHARLMFIPSYARYDQEELIGRWWGLAHDQRMHIVFVVRSYEYEAYHERLHDRCSIFYLPDDTQWGIGYARYIIVKMMKAWGVKYGIMCDDSIQCCYELRESESGTSDLIAKDFKEMLTAICELYSGHEMFADSVACVSPTVYTPEQRVPTDCFIWRAPTMCYVLNLQLIFKKEINFRPLLRKYMEELLFGLECYEQHLKCLQWKQFFLYEVSGVGGGRKLNASFVSPQ